MSEIEKMRGNHHARCVSAGMRRAWRLRGTRCAQCGRRYLRPRRFTAGELAQFRGYYLSGRKRPDLCATCERQQEAGR